MPAHIPINKTCAQTRTKYESILLICRTTFRAILSIELIESLRNELDSKYYASVDATFADVTYRY